MRKGVKKLSPSDPITSVREIKGRGVFPEPEPRVFKPVKAFRYKQYFYVFILFACITICLGLFVGFIAFMVNIEDSTLQIGSDLNQMAVLVTLGYSILSICWIVPSLILIPVYLRSFKYVVHGTEIVVHKGLVNKSVKHVPFRTITHIASRAGILDRFFGIGTVEIQTAGGSGSSTGPEEKIEGIRVYKEVRDYILIELRKLKPAQQATGIETVALDRGPGETVSVDLDTGFLTEMLEELRDIKELLAEKEQ